MVVQLVVHLLFFGVMLNRKSFSSAFIIQKLLVFSSYLLPRSKTDQSFIIMGISSLDCSQVLKSPFVRIMLTIKNQAPSFMTMCEFCNVWKEEVNELKLSLQCLKITPKMSQFYKVCHAKDSSKNIDLNGKVKDGWTALCLTASMDTFTLSNHFWTEKWDIYY